MMTVCYGSVFPCHLSAIVLGNGTMFQMEAIMGHREDGMRSYALLHISVTVNVSLSKLACHLI